MAPPDDSLYIGDTVTVFDMPEDTGLNGIMGTLVKPVGKGRWSLKVDGDDKSKVVPTPNLRKVNLKGTGGLAAAGSQERTPEKDKYSIVGTWYDWDPQDMIWNPSSKCFEFTTTIGSDGSESFKILRNGDWDACIYPDRKDASPYDDHKLLGPDAGGLNEEWTIGVHQQDKVVSGMRVKIKLRVLGNGMPTRVDWEEEREQVQKPVEEEPRTEPAEVQRPRPRISFVDNAEKREPAASRVKAAEANLFENFGGGGQERQYQPKTWEQVKAQEDVEEVERKARERLMARFAAAAEPLAIEDEDGPGDGTNWAEEIADRQRIDRLQQVEANKRRYRRSIEEATLKPGQLSSEEVTRRMQHAVRQCVQCGKMTASFIGNGMCEPCTKAWDKVQEKGEKTDVIPGHLPAGLRIYLRMKKSQMNAGEPREEEEEVRVTNDKPMKRAAAARKKAAEEAEAAAVAQKQREDEDPYWDEIPLPK